METLERSKEATAEVRQAFEGKDVLKQVVISALAVAPDGSSVVYVRRTVEDGKYARRLWRVGWDGGKVEQLTFAAANDARPRFSPDGGSILFISDRSGKPQAWIMSTAGGEPRQVTDLASGVGAADWSPDGRRLLLLGGSGQKRFIVGSAEDPVARRIGDYTWRIDGGGFRDEFTSIWIADLDGGGEPWRLTPASFNVEGAAWSPDGEEVAFTADLGENAGLMEIADLWALRARPGQTEKPRPLASLKSGIANLAWSPSRHLAFIGVDRPDLPGWAEGELHVFDGQKARRLAAGKGLNVGVTSYGDYEDGDNFGPPPLYWADEGHVVALVSHHGRGRPYRFGIDGSVEMLAEPDAVCTSVATGGGRVAVIAAGGEPCDVFAVEDGRMRRLTTDGSSWFGPFNRPIERFSVRHADGHEIEGWLRRASGRDVAPLIVHVHGGPNLSHGPVPWLEMNALADAGFHVVWTNPRGSTSYGEKYARDLEGLWGDPDGSDLLRVIDWAVDEAKITERGKLGIMGLSYGGFMTTYMLGAHPGVFAAAVCENPVTDMLGEWATSDFGLHIAGHAVGAGEPWSHPEEYIARSPFARIHLNHAPLLMLQAENDIRCPAGQTDMVFLILRMLGRKVEMVRYPGESHLMLMVGRPDRRVDRIDRTVAWFKEHLPAN